MGTGGLTLPRSTSLSGRLRTAREVFLWVIGLRTRHRVVNVSMEPTVLEGDFLLVNPRAYRDVPPAPGDLVIACHPQDTAQLITKRVARVEQTGVELSSDNPNAGSDSRHFGLVPAPLLCGQVTCVIR